MILFIFKRYYVIRVDQHLNQKCTTLGLWGIRRESASTRKYWAKQCSTPFVSARFIRVWSVEELNVSICILEISIS